MVGPPRNKVRGVNKFVASNSPFRQQAFLSAAGRNVMFSKTTVFVGWKDAAGFALVSMARTVETAPRNRFAKSMYYAFRQAVNFIAQTLQLTEEEWFS